MPRKILEIKSKEDLEKFIKDLENFVNDVVIQEDYVNIAFDLIQSINNFLKNNPTFPKDDKEAYKRLEKILIKLKFIALPKLSEEEIIDLIKFHFADVFEFDLEIYNLWEKIKSKLITIPFLSERDDFKMKLQTALMENTQELTEQRPIIGEKEQDPTVKNWLLDYKNNVGEEPVDELTISKYLNSANNPVKLNEVEKKRLEYLIKFFEKLKISSFDPRGFEESFLIKRGEKYYIYTSGILEDITKNKKVLDILNFLKKEGILKDTIFEKMKEEKEKEEKLPPMKKTYIYKAEEDIFSKENLKENIERIIKQTLGDIPKIRDELYEAINKNRIKDILACIYILKELGGLWNLFEEERFRKLYKDIVSRSHPSLASKLKENLSDKRTIKDFLTYLLFTNYQLPKNSIDTFLSKLGFDF